MAQLDPQQKRRLAVKLLREAADALEASDQELPTIDDILGEIE